MGLLGTLLRTAIHVTTTPIDVVKDVVTMGGLLTDQEDSYTMQKARKLERDLSDLEDDVSAL